MAKDLPYFKFFCSEWNDGDITLEDYKTQGIFINICSYYWSNECDITFTKLHKKFKDYHGIIDILLESELIKEYKANKVAINFLDEQWEERKATSKRNSKAGKKSAELRKNKKATTVEFTLNENTTNKKRREEIREEKNKKFLIFWELYPKKVNKKDSLVKWMKLTDEEIVEISKTIKLFIAYKPFEDYTHPNPTTYFNQKRWQDVIEESQIKKVVKQVAGDPTTW